jgi:hypothetical protein
VSDLMFDEAEYLAANPDVESAVKEEDFAAGAC